MPHQTAIAELEIADIYLELNLAEEAFEIYEKVSDNAAQIKIAGRRSAGAGKFRACRREFRK